MGRLAGKLGHDGGTHLRRPGYLRPSCWVGTLKVSLAVMAETAATAQITAVKMLIWTQPPGLMPPMAATIAGAKPAIRKPSWVPMARPENRTLVLNISA